MNDTLNEEISALIRTHETTREEIDRASLVVTASGAIIKNRNGKLTDPTNNLVCTLDAMNIKDDIVHLHFPEHECCDMNAAIRLANCAHPSVTAIQTWSGEKQGTCYATIDGRWKALRPG